MNQYSWRFGARRDDGETVDREPMPASLNEILTSSPAQSPAPTAPAAEVASAPAADASPAENADAEIPGDEGDEFETATPAVQPGATKPHEDKRSVPFAALKDERRKRQELERQLAELQGQVKVYSQTVKPATQESAPSPEDQFYRDPVSFIRQQTSQERLRISEDLMRETHPDYDEVIQQFVEATNAAPHLIGQFHAAANPAKFAYNAGKAYKQAREYGSIDDMRAKIREELKTEVREELRREAAQQAANAVQPSLANARGTGVSPTPPRQGPKPLKQIFGR